jgi:hypothetical protein
LLGWSVAAMGWSMVLGGAVDASVALAVGSTAVAAAVTGYAVTLYRPLFRQTPSVLASRPGVDVPSLHS